MLHVLTHFNLHVLTHNIKFPQGAAEGNGSLATIYSLTNISWASTECRALPQALSHSSEPAGTRPLDVLVGAPLALVHVLMAPAHVTLVSVFSLRVLCCCPRFPSGR